MLLFKKHSAVKEFKGTGSFFWLSFKGKVYVAAIVFLLGILIQGFIILLFYGQTKQELLKEDQLHDQARSEINSLASLSPTLLSRCQAGLAAGAAIETSDVFENLNIQIVSLKEQLGQKNIQILSLVKNFKLLNEQINQYNNSSLSIPQYLEIKQVYSKYIVSLINLEKNLNQYQNYNVLNLLSQQGWLFLLTLSVFIIMITLCSILLITAAKSIVMPAKLMTHIFNEAKHKVFNVDLPITSDEGLGNAALILNESLTNWNSKFLVSKNSIRRFNSLCQELVTEIRKTELFAIQLQKVAEALSENFENQSRLITQSHAQLTVLLSNSDELHKIPQRLIIINDDLKNQLAVVQMQIREILNRTIEYQDESTAIADLTENLNIASEKVTGVVFILDEVAERTEMLAFNTAIQAARAGEKGLGFGVVAKEIAKLVNHSKKASVQLSDLLYKIKVKNEHILKLIAGNSGSTLDKVPIYDEVSKICSSIFETAQTSFDNIGKLTKVMEVIFVKSNELSKEAHLISRLTAEDNIGDVNFDLETLDYQLNVKEANRMAMKISEISEELKKLAETAAGEEDFLY
jgi:methyl-accepting chemotaxis protein